MKRRIAFIILVWCATLSAALADDWKPYALTKKDAAAAALKATSGEAT